MPMLVRLQTDPALLGLHVGTAMLRLSVWLLCLAIGVSSCAALVSCAAG